MNIHSFQDYLHSAYPSRNSRAAQSYIKAISILDELFRKRDVFDLNNQSLSEIRDPLLLSKIIDYIAEEEDKFRREEESIFDLGKSTQTSYPKKRFCTAAIRRLGEYVDYLCGEEATEIMRDSALSGERLSSELLAKFHINKQGTEKEILAKHRIGQNLFRAMLLKLYHKRCCLTDIDIPEVLRASHIIPWSERKATRLNPENGLCLSATYDAAFDQHLISFDEDFRMILSPMLKERYTSEAFKTHFRKFEGKAITLPSIYAPSQEFLETHRSKLVV
ncbi:HNH endonuclease [Muribaculaceae bacterium Isolate-037 (Harlan)]|jgi:putative restriction endonuclease|nr:HNH endonuclease [Muribaculaceae bacterium Isolate-037 (Harlan)]